MIRTKQPTIEDIYAFDNYISTPGVRQGLLERAGDGDPELTIEDTDDGQVVYYNAPHGEQVAVGRPIQLAMGGNAAGRNSNAPISDVPMALMDMGAGVARGAVAQTLGLPGDLEKLYNGLKSVFNRPEDQPRLDAFIKGMEQPTTLPTTERMGEILPPVVPAGAPNAQQRQGSANYGQAFGELAPLPGGIEAGTAAVKAGAKALAPKAGEMIINSMEKLGTPVKMNAVENGPSAVAKATAPTNDIGFYSAVEQAALNIKRNSGNGQAMLNDLMKGENVKADEIKWIGLDDFLKGKKNVTKQEVQDFIANNKVDVQEVQLGDSAYTYKYIDANESSSGEAGWMVFDQEGRFAGGPFEDELTAEIRAESLTESGSTNAKFAKWQLPGGENYREILLTMPDNQMRQYAYDVFNPRTQESKQFATRAEAEAYANKDPFGNTVVAEVEVGNRKPEYRSSHWSEPNVLAHLRVNDRVDADGKKMLLVEEVQSDWHQAGRDKGYAGADKVKGYQVSVNGRPLMTYETKAEAEAHIARANALDPEQNVSMAEVEASPQLINEFAKGKVPDAPMKDTWYQLALKRALKYAADNGYDRVGLTTGARQAERYDLSKQIDAVEYKRNPDGGGVIIADDKSGKTVLSERIQSDAQVADYIGKEAAKKLLDQSPVANTGTDAMSYVLNNTDLQVGGEGMKQYYDQTYPQFLAKYGKKWGAKSGETYIPIYDKKTQKAGAEPIRYIDITPEMRESVGKGQPLFSAAGAGSVGVGATIGDKEQK